MTANWTADEIPSQAGRTALVTGANSGLGLATAQGLARAGASVLLACRDTAKGVQATTAIRAAVPGAAVEVRELDLASLSSVRALASQLDSELDRLDLLINNAGVMASPRRLTADGFERHLGTNHLGHFALTGLLLGKLLAADDPRVVTVSAGLHRMGTIDFDDLQRERGYNRWRAYAGSKLANLMFCFELDRRARAAGLSLRSMASHPGYAATNLQFAGPSKAYERVSMAVSNRIIAQSSEGGALPTLYAATVVDLPGGSFVGPDGFMELRGHPHVVTADKKAYDQEAWRRLWEISEELTGVRYELAAAKL